MADRIVRTLRLWFLFEALVDARTCFRHGVALMAAKYAVDVAIVWLGAHRFWSPLQYLNPSLGMRANQVNLPSARYGDASSRPGRSPSPSRPGTHPWYTLDIHPEVYWNLWADAIVESIHHRVLAHIRGQVEAEAARHATTARSRAG